MPHTVTRRRFMHLWLGGLGLSIYSAARYVGLTRREADAEAKRYAGPAFREEIEAERNARRKGAAA